MFNKIVPHIEKILRYANDIFVIKDTENRIIFVNDRIKEYGYDPESLVGKSYMHLLSSKHKGKRFSKIIGEKIRLNYEVEFLRCDKSIVNALESNAPIYDDSGNVLFVVSILTDITSYKELQKRLIKSTYIDYLTRLYNIRYLYRRLREELKRADRKGEGLAVVMLDVDNFKKYNDCFGHEEGNKILKKIGTIIRSSIREGVDLGFRFGGDEFVILVNQTGEGVAKEIASRVRAKFLELGGKFLNLSIGIAYYNHGQSVKDLIIEADKKTYKAKKSSLKIIE